MLGALGAQGRDVDGLIADFKSKFGWTGHPTQTVVNIHESLLPFPEAAVFDAWSLLLRGPWLDLPRNPRDVGLASLKSTTYHRWFALPLPASSGGGSALVAEAEGYPRMPTNMPGYIKCSKGIQHSMSI